jgi:hypothetical protein
VVPAPHACSRRPCAPAPGAAAWIPPRWPSAGATVEPWAALGSPRGATEATNAQSLRALRAAVAEAGRQRGRFEAWVTHMFVLSDLAGTGSGSGEGLVLRAGVGGSVQVLARLAPPPV